jgi:hypothetical protein
LTGRLYGRCRRQELLLIIFDPSSSRWSWVVYVDINST